MMKWIKGNIFMILLLAVLLTFAGIGIVTRFKQQYTAPQEQTTTETTSSTEKPTTPSVEETVDERHYRQAKLKLEQPYSQASEEEKQMVAAAIAAAIQDIQKAEHLSTVKGSMENHLTMSHDAMIQTFAMAILVNKYEYQEENLEVMPSENEDVVQFLIVLSKEGEETCYFVGNFNTTVHQIQLKAYVGGNIGGTFG